MFIFTEQITLDRRGPVATILRSKRKVRWFKPLVQIPEMYFPNVNEGLSFVKIIKKKGNKIKL